MPTIKKTYGSAPSAYELAKLEIPQDDWRILAVFLLACIERRRPSLAAAIMGKVRAEAVTWKYLKRGNPGWFQTQLVTLNYGRGKVKKDLLIPRDLLRPCHKKLKSYLKTVKGDLKAIKQGFKAGGRGKAVEALWQVVDGERILLGWVELARDGLDVRSPEQFVALVQEQEVRIWRILVQAHLEFLNHSIPGISCPPTPTLDRMAEACMMETPANASLTVLAKICGVSPEHIRGEVSAPPPRYPAHEASDQSLTLAAPPSSS
jgi:hypothetical protein